MKISLRFNLVIALRILHGLVVVALVAGCIHLGVRLYDQFYLPYNLEDTPIVPAASEATSPAVRSLLQTAELLEQRFASTTAPRAVPEVFWPAGAPTSTAR